MQEVIVIKPAYYNNMLLKPDDVVVICDKKLPSWAKPKDLIKRNRSGKRIKNAKKESLFIEDCLNDKLSELKTLGLAKGILLDDIVDKSMLGQIKEFEKILLDNGG